MKAKSTTLIATTNAKHKKTHHSLIVPNNFPLTEKALDECFFRDLNG